MHIPVMNNQLTKLFRKKEIFSAEDFFRYDNRKKIVVYIPADSVERLTLEMSKAGAGQIGNYEMCSFRISGTGTFIPNKKARPFNGKKNSLNYAEEIRLEMECPVNQINKVVTALLKNHPYDEAVYEIYDFMKREKKPIGLTIYLKSPLSFKQLFKRINRSDIQNEFSSVHKISRLALINTEPDDTIIDSAKFINCNCIISLHKKNFKLIIL
ncbi:MAG: hypothetical protein ABI462_03435 [Ignavibacteria bacterium]